jgi:site-specific DNA-methyltransferase (adenine-specific)
LKKGTHLYMFCDEETRDVVTCGWSPVSPRENLGCSPLLLAGFKYWKAIIWDKVVAGMGYHYRAQHEFIIMAEKIERVNKHRQLNSHEAGDVLHVPAMDLGRDVFQQMPSPETSREKGPASGIRSFFQYLMSGAGVLSLTATFRRIGDDPFLMGDLGDVDGECAPLAWNTLYLDPAAVCLQDRLSPSPIQCPCP